MDTLTIYHNPRCSKSRSALALLQERELPLRVVEYLKEPPTRAELAALRRRSGLSPGEWVRKSESEYKAAGLDARSSEESCSMRWRSIRFSSNGPSSFAATVPSSADRPNASSNC